jgi:hypothetical protein
MIRFMGIAVGLGHGGASCYCLDLPVAPESEPGALARDLVVRVGGVVL